MQVDPSLSFPTSLRRLHRAAWTTRVVNKNTHFRFAARQILQQISAELFFSSSLLVILPSLLQNMTIHILMSERDCYLNLSINFYMVFNFSLVLILTKILISFPTQFILENLCWSSIFAISRHVYGIQNFVHEFFPTFYLYQLSQFLCKSLFMDNIALFVVEFWNFYRYLCWFAVSQLS